MLEPMSDSNPAKPKIAHRRKARSLLLQALYQWQLSNSPLAEIEAQFREDNTAKVDWDFFHQVFTGVVTRADEIDELVSPYLDRKLTDLNPVELALLRMGCFELSERLDVPYKVVINECINLAKKFGAAESYKYINGVLDKAARKLRAVEISSQEAERE